MRIGVITEGQSEVQSLPPIVQQIRIQTGNTIINPVHSNFSPDADYARIAKACRQRIRLLQSSKRIHRLVVMLDRESPSRQISEIESRLSTALSAIAPSLEVFVVVKNLMFENWLISDPIALQAMPKRFSLTDHQIAQIEQNGADSIDAPALLRQITPTRSGYRKVQDAKAILSHANIYRMSDNSISFRNFVHACT